MLHEARGIVRFCDLQPQHNIEPVTQVLHKYMFIDCMN